MLTQPRKQICQSFVKVIYHSPFTVGGGRVDSYLPHFHDDLKFGPPEQFVLTVGEGQAVKYANIFISTVLRQAGNTA